MISGIEKISTNWCIFDVVPRNQRHQPIISFRDEHRSLPYRARLSFHLKEKWWRKHHCYASLLTDKQFLIEYYDNYPLSSTNLVLYPNVNLEHPYPDENRNSSDHRDTWREKKTSIFFCFSPVKISLLENFSLKMFWRDHKSTNVMLICNEPMYNLMLKNKIKWPRSKMFVCFRFLQGQTEINNDGSVYSEEGQHHYQTTPSEYTWHWYNWSRTEYPIGAQSCMVPMYRLRATITEQTNRVWRSHIMTIVHTMPENLSVRYDRWCEHAPVLTPRWCLHASIHNASDICNTEC